MEVHIRSIKCNIFYLKQKYIVGKSTNKSSNDDTGIAGTSLEVEVNLVKQLGLTTLDSFGSLQEVSLLVSTSIQYTLPHIPDNSSH